MDDISDIQEYYNAAWDYESSRLTRHQLEHDITWRYLEKYLPPAGSYLLEIGSATGNYTLELARRGYKVLAVDLSPELVTRARARVNEASLDNHVEFRVGDIRTLTGLPGSTFDGVLMMGPLYHLVLREDRLLALNQVSRVSKPGSVLFTSWISRFGIFGDLMKNMADIVETPGEMTCLLEKGRDPDNYRGGKGNFRGYFARADEICPIHEEAGFQVIALAGVEPAISVDDASYNCLEGKRRQLWLDLLFDISSEPNLVASSRHLLFVGKKPGI